MAAATNEENSFLHSIGKRKTMPHTLVLEHVSPATRLLEKRRQMFEVQEALEAQKQEFNRKEEVFKRREEGLKKKDLELQESLIRFSKFLQENDSKRTRAEKKASDEIKLRSQKEGEIEQLNVTLGDLKGEKKTTSDVVEKNMSYQKYLETVLDVADEYHEINDLLMRYATLEATNNDLREHAKECNSKNEETRAALQAYTKMKTDEILNLNNSISRLKKELESRERDSLVTQSNRDYNAQITSQKTLENGQVCMATDNLFHRCNSRSKVNHPPYTNPLEQLGVIGDFMADLGAIVKQWKQSGKQARLAGDK
mmetsp:Transcript_41925/g.50804  ORF Transcript_41925/g.50804 Transcript_41925/m.50804 type:complete len:312 (-) Transcript_41925:960-1895(-)|eukprot:CAMPEP_0197855564 /NCGR_PEP_ID=MMETSP1438-20131217/26867_1 /TAXON_ID=1461541 /ORGANISM="Pterosperma sp., Strain CCMP1384" /LENGTH=311 /DNA_ID=CAMNT_0043470727 /DNA_START=163 /DNA_END=1098 /DNA_ORIENTATION=-